MSHTIRFAAAPTRWQKLLAIELSAILGFEQPTLRFPLLSDDGDLIIAAAEGHEGIALRGKTLFLHVEENRASVIRLCHELMTHTERYLSGTQSPRTCQLPQSCHPSSDHPLSVSPCPLAGRSGLASLFEVGDFFESNGSDWLPERTLLRLFIGSELSLSQTSAACMLAARIGAECGTHACPITLEQDDGVSPLLHFCADGHPGLSFDKKTRPVITVFGDGAALEEFVVSFCGRFPQIGEGACWQEFLRDMEDGAALKNLDGQLAWLEAGGGRGECYFSPLAEKRAALTARFPHAHLHEHQTLTPLLGESFSFEWEVERCRAVLQEQLYPLLSPGDRVRVQLVLSEGKEVRSTLADEVTSELVRRGAVAERTEVLCACKQGYCWVDEVVLPALEQCREPIAKVEIVFRPFLPPDGVQWMDQPVRFLQELYPVDDLIATRLGICRDAICFTQADTVEGNATYTLYARSAEGHTLFCGSYRTAVSERRYLDMFPETALVHPATGAVRAWINGVAALDIPVKTDLECIWDAYQSRVLPICRSHIERSAPRASLPDAQPFFAQLRLDVTVSEPEELLPFREDMLSPGDALHEDLYFAGLDFFRLLGMQLCGRSFDAPGLILPMIHLKQGAPSMAFTIFAPLHPSPALLADGIPTAHPSTMHAVLKSLFYTQIGTEATVSVTATQDLRGYLCAYAQLLSEGLLDCSRALNGISHITFLFNGEYAAEASPPQLPTPPPLDIADIDLMENRLIDYDDCMRILDQLRRVPGVAVHTLAKSVQGRSIHAIELLPSHGEFQSRAKRVRLNPGKLIVARHHANEVSATNACFLYLRTLLKDPEFHGIANRLNLILLPMENPDGAAVHAMLQKEHPRWKLHTARFNALGREFATGYFDDNTMHTEALAFTRVYRQWMPDMVVENHGVPSHEWDQPFSGYTAPMFRSYWLPRALLYSYFWQIDHPDYAANLPLNASVEDAVAVALTENSEVMRLNRDWRERFEKYAHAWLPEQFPVSYYRDMISYRYDMPYRPRGYVSVCYPWLTAVDFVSEVSDETAVGRYLALCAQTHLLHELSTTRLLDRTVLAFRSTLSERGGQLVKRCERLRPPFLPGQE